MYTKFQSTNLWRMGTIWDPRHGGKDNIKIHVKNIYSKGMD